MTDEGTTDSEFLDDASGDEESSVADQIMGTDTSSDATSTASSTSTEKKEIATDKTFEDELKQICNSRDYHIIVNQNNECIITTPEPPAQAEFVIKPWMVKKNSFNYNAGFSGNGKAFEGSWIPISTQIEVSYNNGVAVVRIPELYDMYGAVNTIQESKPEMHREEAELYGYQRLVQELRDNAIEIEFEMLLTGEVYPGRWVGVTNPKNGSYNILWVDTISINLDPTKTYSMTVKCLYMPKTPDKGTTSTDSLASIDEIGKAAGGFSYCHSCQTAECMEKSNCGDCWAMSDWIYKKCMAAGIKAKIVEYDSGVVPNHRSVLIDTGSGWQDFPYRNKEYNINSMFYNTSASLNGRTLQ